MTGLLAYFRSAAWPAMLARRLVMVAVMMAVAGLPLAHACPRPDTNLQSHALSAHSSALSHGDHAHHDAAGHPPFDPDWLHHCPNKCCLTACMVSVLPASFEMATLFTDLVQPWRAHDDVKRGVIQRVATPPPRLA